MFKSFKTRGRFLKKKKKSNPHKKHRFQCAQRCVCRAVGLWRQSKTESGERLFRCYITVLFITGNWVVFLKVTTWLSRLNITNKARPLSPPFLWRKQTHPASPMHGEATGRLTAMIITEALSAFCSSAGHIQAVILSLASSAS